MSLSRRAMCERIRETARRIPLGGTIRIKGSKPISGYNLAEHVARMIEHMECERDIYHDLCDQAANE